MAEGMGNQRQAIAVDLGGTNLRAAVLSADGTLTHRVSAPTEAKQGADAVVTRIGALVNRIAEEAQLDRAVPVGAAAPGPLNPKTGIVHFTPNLPGWRDFPLRDRLVELTGRSVEIDNDANCAALGEARYGSARDVDHMIYLGIGTGMGGGVVVDGKLVEGALGLGGELGHVTVAMDGPRCTCGSIGCLEAFAAGWAIAYEANLVAQTSDGAALRNAAGDGPITATDVAAAADGGDPAATAILDRAGTALGAAIGVFINIFNPDLVVIGGGLMSLGDHLLDPARRAIPRHSFRAQREHARLVLAALGDDSGLFGAGAIALDRGNE
jgi:glucokinase